MQKERTFIEKLSLFFKGLIMGAANKVPGVSGGTIALVTGIYEQLINSLKSFNIQAVKLLFSGNFKSFIEHIDIVSILEKMKVELNDFKINTIGSLTQEHPKYYNKVSVEYHFYGEQLDKEKINKAVNLSITKYCGVMEMFRSFAEITTEIHYNS